MTFPSLRPPRSRRSGSALIIVLGILSILLVMSVTFSALVRTERGGTTNLKNSQIAREALQSALVQAMEAIEQSFDNPTNNWPVPCWPYPWIASAQEPGDDVVAFDSGAFSGLYYQSGHVEDGAPDAHVMFPGMSAFLTPAQVALVRSAKCGWSPLRASIAATSDGVVGRCAYVALDTTGYLDANIVHRYPDDRASTIGDDPYAFKLPSSSDNLKDIHGKKIPCSLTSPTQFASARTAAKSFLSFADLRHYCAAKDVDRTRDVKGKYPALNLEPPSNTTDPFPADLFSFSSLSLDELAPNGQPKIALPADGFASANACKKWGARTLRAMAEVFALSRKNAGVEIDASDRDTYTFFPRLQESDRVKVTRARLATVALLDALDEDTMPGRHKSFGNYWNSLPDLPASDGSPVVVAGKKIADRQPGSTGNSLNFPATDTIPLLDRAYAYMCITEATPVLDTATPDESYITYKGEIRVGGMALNLNWSKNDAASDYTLSVECEVLAGRPAGSASKPGSKDLRTKCDSVKSAGHFEWSFDGKEATESDEDAFASASTSSDSTTVRGGQDTKNRYLAVEATIPFEVKAWVTDVIRTGGSGGGEEGGGDGGSRPPRGGASRQGAGRGEEDGGGGGGGEGETVTFTAKARLLKDTFETLPVRARFKISQGATVVQQVPAPALDKAAEKSWWLCMNMGVPDNAECRGVDSADLTGEGRGGGTPKVHKVDEGGTVTSTTMTVDPDKGLPSKLGWAVCVAPAFAFDTTSLYCSTANSGPSLPNSTGTLCGGYWLNDQWKDQQWMQDLAAMIQNESKADDKYAANCADIFQSPGSHGGSGADFGGAYAFTKFLFDAKSYGDGYSRFVSYGMNDGPVPDLLHACKQGDSVFANYNGKDFDISTLAMSFYTHVDNEPMTSAGQIGNVMCGPHETISLYETYRNSSDHRPDFHRVLDYFTTSESRYPNEDDDGAPNATGLGQSQIYSGVHHGRVNLNMPYLVKWSNKLMTRAKESDVPNLFPFVAAINGASCSALDPDRALPVSSAGLIAADFANSEHRFQHNRKFDCDRDMVFSVAELGLADSGTKENILLRNLCDDVHIKPECDADRESLLANAANAFTTRGQSFLVVIRADAYSPMFGMGADVKEGTSLATTHAIVELWRDPEPARYADGSFPTDGDGNEVVYHNWQVRSFRIF